MKYLSLFSGVGGFELGIEQAYETKISIRDRETENTRTEALKQGLESTTESVLPDRDKSNNIGRRDTGQVQCIGFSEIDKYATKVYKHHFPNHKEYGDITKINEKELPDFDLLVGGFPCQSFSIAGKRGGFEDTRGTMFFEIARIVREKQPRLLLLENVKGLLSHDKGNTFRTIISTLDELGYDCQWQVLNSKNHGVPQNRERVFIVGNRRGTKRPKLYFRGTSRPQVFPFTESTGQNLQQLVGGSQGNRLYHKQGVSVCLASQAGGQGAKTGLYAVDDYVTEDTKIRRLTPTECERLQGFPDGWTDVEGMSDTQRYKQMGNAVTVNVIRDIVEKMFADEIWFSWDNFDIDDFFQQAENIRKNNLLQ